MFACCALSNADGDEGNGKTTPRLLTLFHFISEALLFVFYVLMPLSFLAGLKTLAFLLFLLLLPPSLLPSSLHLSPLCLLHAVFPLPVSPFSLLRDTNHRDQNFTVPFLNFSLWCVPVSPTLNSRAALVLQHTLKSKVKLVFTSLTHFSDTQLVSPWSLCLAGSSCWFSGSVSALSDWLAAQAVRLPWFHSTHWLWIASRPKPVNVWSSVSPPKGLVHLLP